MIHQRFIVIVLALTLWAGPLLAQTPGQPAGETPDQTPATDKPAANTAGEEQEKIKQQAVVLLREVADEAGRMQLPENRIFYQSEAAELMWSADEKSARDFYQSAMADMRAVYTRPVGDDDEDRVKYRRLAEAGMLRRNLLLSIARHDPKLARNFLRETHELVIAGGNGADNQYANDAQLELALGLQIAQNDPEQALEIGRQTLAKGFSSQIVTLAESIYKKNPDDAAKLTGEAITKLKNANLNQDKEAAALAVALFQKGVAPAENKGKDKPAASLLDESALRDLAEMITAAALNAGAEDYTLTSLGSILDQLEKYAPARVHQLRRKYGANGEGTGAGSDERSGWNDFVKLRDEGTVDQLIQAADKQEIPDMRGMYYDAAVTKLVAAGEVDRARGLVASKVTDPETKKRLSQAIEQGALQQAAAKGNLEESRRLLSNVKTNEEKIVALAQLAASVGVKDKKTALLLLEEASNLSVPHVRNYRQMLARLALVRAYAPLDPEAAFNILESSVDQANELLAAFFLVGEFIAEEELVRDDEVTMFQLSSSLWSEVGEYRSTVKALAQADFKRMKSVADRFQRPEIRLLARLLVAQSVLATETDDDSVNAAPAGPVIDD